LPNTTGPFAGARVGVACGAARRGVRWPGVGRAAGVRDGVAVAVARVTDGRGVVRVVDVGDVVRVARAGARRAPCVCGRDAPRA